MSIDLVYIDPARAHAWDLAAEIGLGRGTTAGGPLWHTLTRLDRFRLVSLAWQRAAPRWGWSTPRSRR